MIASSKSAVGMPGAATRIMEFGVLFLVLSLLFARGTFHQALDILALGVALKVIGAERPLKVPPTLRWALWLLALFWIWGVVVNQGRFWQSGNMLLWMGVLLIAFFQLPSRLFSRIAWRELLVPLLVAFVIVNGIADFFYRGTIYVGRGHPGLFSNIHYLSEYVVLTAPAFVFSIIRGQGWTRTLAFAALFGDLILMVASKSRPGFLAAIASALILIPLVAPVARLWIVGGMSLILGSLYLGDIGQFSERVDDFFMHLREDERAEIWTQVIEMFITNTPSQWLLGHGVGQFLMDFHQRGIEEHFRVYLSPHNFLFEILYSHGLLGLLTVMGAILSLYGFLVRAIGMSADTETRLAGYTLVSTLTASLVHGIFTIPFYSRDFLLPFGVVVGLVLLYIERSPNAPSAGR